MCSSDLYTVRACLRTGQRMLVPNAGSEESLNLPRRVALSSGRSSAQGGD